LAGITGYGSYLSYNRLQRAAIGAGKGERSVASYDEDSVSMAVEAGRDAVRGSAPIEPNAFSIPNGRSGPAVATSLGIRDNSIARRHAHAHGHWGTLGAARLPSEREQFALGAARRAHGTPLALRAFPPGGSNSRVGRPGAVTGPPWSLPPSPP